MKTKNLVMLGGAIALVLFLRKKAAAAAATPAVVTAPKPTGNYVLV